MQGGGSEVADWTAEDLGRAVGWMPPGEALTMLARNSYLAPALYPELVQRAVDGGVADRVFAAAAAARCELLDAVAVLAGAEETGAAHAHALGGRLLCQRLGPLSQAVQLDVLMHVWACSDDGPALLAMVLRHAHDDGGSPELHRLCETFVADQRPGLWLQPHATVLLPCALASARLGDLYMDHLLGTIDALECGSTAAAADAWRRLRELAEALPRLRARACRLVTHDHSRRPHHPSSPRPCAGRFWREQ